MASARKIKGCHEIASNGARIVDWHPASIDLLVRLRMLALRCRASARADLFEACALLHASGEAAAGAHAEALVRTLPQALGRLPKFHRPGVEEVSFDEAWLLRLFEAAAAPDPESFQFLLRSRVRPSARPGLRFLVSHTAAAGVCA